MSVLVVAHRGASGTHPENTIAAFGRALEIGVDMVEFDVRHTADGVAVLMHDETPDRTTSASGGRKVEEMSSDEIRALDAGGWKGERFRGERVPTFADALDFFAPHGVLLNIHVKASPSAEQLEALIREIKARGMTSRAYIAPDDAESIPLVRRLSPQINFILLDRGGSDDEYIRTARNLKVATLQPNRRRMSRGFMDAVHRAGMRANVFFADEPEEMRRFIEMGVDGILTNFPERLKQVLGDAADY